MEGELEKASSALDRIWWQPYKDDGETVDTSPIDSLANQPFSASVGRYT